jgi:uncharacterized protein (TIGR02246 family)
MSHSVSFRSLLSVLLLHLSLASIVRAQTTQDEHAIRTIIQAHATAWNNRDPVAAAAILMPDGVWITSTGNVLRGRAAVERAHRQWLADDSAQGGSTHSHPPETIRIRFLRPDVAVADLEGQNVGGRARDGTPLPPRRYPLFVVVSKYEGQWRIAEVRNTVGPRS